MKLLQIGASWLSYQFSGLERYYAELVTHLPSLGVEVTAIVYELNEGNRSRGITLFKTICCDDDFPKNGRNRRSYEPTNH
jgi:hypothetical protein